MRLLTILLFLLFLIPVGVKAQGTFPVTCSGNATADTAKFSAIVTSTGSNDVTITLPYKKDSAERCTLNTLSLPLRVTLDNTNGSGIKVTTGQTLTILGPIVNPAGKTMFFNVSGGQGTVAASGYKFRSTDVPIVESDLAITDVTTANATTLKHGFMPKLSGDPSKCFVGDGTQVACPGTVGSGLTSLGGQTGASQTFSKTDDTNVTLAITSNTNVHNFTLGWTGTLADARLTTNIPKKDAANVFTNSNTFTNPIFKSQTGVFARAQDTNTGQQITLKLPASVFTSYDLALPPNPGTTGQYLTSIASSAGTVQLGFVSPTTTPVSLGGTGKAVLGTSNLLVGAGTSAISEISPGPSGWPLLSVGGTSWAAGQLAVGGIATSSLTGSGTKLATNTGGTSSGKCVEWDALGNLVTAVSNAACGSGGGGGGAVNSAANIGSSGVGLFSSLAVDVLQFKNINATSTKITVTNNAGLNTIDLDVPDASTTQKGASSMSVAGTTVAVGTTDGRVPTQDENNALVGTFGTVGSANPYRTFNDPQTSVERVIGEFSGSSLPAAVSSIGATPTTLVINASSPVASNVTVPSTLVLRVTGAGQLSVSAGVTATIPLKNIDAPLDRQIFAGAGDVRLTGGGDVSARWFAGADASVKIQAADTACDTNKCTITWEGSDNWSTGVTLNSDHSLRLGEGTLTTTSGNNVFPILMKSRTKITGAGMYKTIITEPTYNVGAGTAWLPVIYSYGMRVSPFEAEDDDLEISDLQILGANTFGDGGVKSAIGIGNGKRFIGTRLFINGTHGLGITMGGISNGSATSTRDGFSVTDSEFRNIWGQNLNSVNGRNGIFHGNRFFDMALTGAFIDLETNTDVDYNEGITISDNTFDSRNTPAGNFPNGIAVTNANNARRVGNIVISGNEFIGGKVTDSDGSITTTSATCITTAKIKDVVITGNICRRTGQTGFSLNGDRHLVTGNLLDSVGGGGASGMSVQVADSRFDGNLLLTRINSVIGAGSASDVILEDTTAISSTVNTSGTTVTRTAGSTFSHYPTMQGQTITINGTPYTVASVTNATVLVLTSTAGTQTGVTATIPVSALYDRNTFESNESDYTAWTGVNATNPIVLTGANSKIISHHDRTSGKTFHGSVNVFEQNTGFGTISPLRLLHAVHQSDGTAPIGLDEYGANAPDIRLRRAAGTIASPTAVQSTNVLGSLSAGGYGATGFSSLPRAYMAFVANENWTDSAQGADTVFFNTAAGGTTTSEKARITGGGLLGVGTPSPAGILHTQGAALVFDDSAGAISGGDYPNVVASSPFTLWSGAGYFRIGTGVTNRASGAGFTARLSILNSNGNVGIGDAAPARLLTVNGIARAQIEDKGGQVFNVQAYGAIPNDGLDDTSAIQATIDAVPAAGGIVLLPRGNYDINATLTIGDGNSTTPSTKGYLSFIGDGSGPTASELVPAAFPRARGATTLRWNGAAGGTMLQLNGPIGNVKIEDIFFDAHVGANAAATAINVVHAMDSTFRRITAAKNTGFAFLVTAYTVNAAGFAKGGDDNVWEQVHNQDVGTNGGGIQLGPSLKDGGVLDVARNTFINCSFRENGTGIGIELRFTDANTFIGVLGGKLVVTPPTDALGFPGGITFINSAIEIDNTSGSNWAGDEAISFYPHPTGDYAGTPTAIWARGVTATGVPFGGTVSITSSATPTPDAKVTSLYRITALAANATIGAPTFGASGSPITGQKLSFQIIDNGTSRNLTWNAAYRAGTTYALPAATTISKTMYLTFIYNAVSSTWDLTQLADGF